MYVRKMLHIKIDSRTFHSSSSQTKFRSEAVKFKALRKLTSEQNASARKSQPLKVFASVDKYTQLGASGLKVSKIGIGTLQWGDEKCGFGTSFREPDLQWAFDTAVEGGINFFDTAEVYGAGNGKYEQSSEHLVGRFAEKADAPVIIGSKVFTIPWSNVIMGGGLRTSPDSLVSALKDSVDRVGRPLDLWSIHFPFPGWNQVKLMDALKEARDLELVRAVGVSNYSPEQLEEAHGILAKEGIPLACNQVKYSLLSRDPEKNGMLKLAEDLDVKVVAYSPLAEGQLAGKRVTDEKVVQLLKLMEFIGAVNGGRSVSQVALNYLVQKGALPIPGCKSAKQAKEHAGALEFELEEAEMETLAEKLDYLKF